MSEAGKPTPGPWTIEKISNGQYVIYGAEGELIESFYEVFGEQRLHANMRLITEAGTVHHETGLTPRQLLAQRDALIDAAIAMIEWDEREKDHAVDFMSRIELCNEAFSKARAALALVKGETK